MRSIRPSKRGAVAGIGAADAAGVEAPLEVGPGDTDRGAVPPDGACAEQPTAKTSSTATRPLLTSPTLTRTPPIGGSIPSVVHRRVGSMHRPGRWRRPTTAVIWSAATILAVIAHVQEVARAAPPGPTWAVTLAANVREGSVAIDGAGNVYVTGYRLRDDAVAVLRKFDPDGSPVWTRTWSHPDAHATGDLVAVAPDGSVYFAGSIGSNHFEGGAWFLRKYHPDGTLVWARDERGWEHGRTADSPSGLAVAPGMVLLSGSDQGCCGDFRIRDGWVLAFGTDGSRRWRSPFEPGGDLDAFSDQAESVTVGAGGGIYVGGWTALGPESEETAAGHELLLQRLDGHGVVVWSKTLPATAHRDQDFGLDLALHSDALMVSAFVEGHDVWLPARPGHAWLARFTLAGDLVWSRQWGASWTKAAQPSAVAVGARGRTFVIGSRRDPSDHGVDAFIRAYSAAGSLVWRRNLEGDERFLVGADIAWRSGSLAAGAEALSHRYDPGTAGVLWSFA
jgi:hypothetical protein